ncbi:MAG TPA: phosphatase PAP2 family protein [Bosea sp. (in: a-proteobacteria)]|jgi:acid phosphatase (class A)|uniref:phosphatase PAP2 family protein n=1 Tax=Bosea sp. (in: a-proteobacteria) TaxID=1871050 RepID=UPI002DDD5B27|nr:phosphatase PAP2 family protein [Bosea sp. (in: a-proteobacteria)]HEV2554665.1 phosphatase PAP2 family protein [Bosea sp. (in: a-proteobacteria)]
MYRPVSRPRSNRLGAAALGLALALLLVPAPADAQQRTSLLWLEPGKVDLATLIGLPPAMNSPEQKREFDEVLQITLNRTPEREKAAIADQYQTLARFLEGADIPFAGNEHREVRLLYREAQIEMGIVLLGVRRLTNRQRPFTVWNKVRVKPCPGGRPEGTSFPAGHAATAALYAELLSVAAPEMAARLEERVKDYGESRLVCGFHYRSDLAAGDKAGRAVAKALLADRAFRARFDETSAETRLALGLK